VGLDADDVFRRFQKQFPPEDAESTQAVHPRGPNTWPAAMRPFPEAPRPPGCTHSLRTRAFGTAADLTVALVFAFGCAAGGSRLLWPVLLIACYYAAGVLLTGTSPMVALLGQSGTAPAKVKEPVTPSAAAAAPSDVPPRQPVRQSARLSGDRPVGQRRGMQAPV
jgi:hypothetical protein